MPVPYVVARFNKRVTNRFIEPIVRRSSRYAAVHHVGRRSGRAYRTPVVTFDLHGDAIVVLTYGTRADWYRNAAVSDAALEFDSGLVPITSIDVVGREVARPALPLFVRAALRVMTVHDVARLSLGQPGG